MLRPRNRADLWLQVLQLFGIRLPHKVFTPGHSSPLDFVWDALSHPGRKLAAWANRSGGKTLCASIIAALEYLHTRGPIRSRVLAGSEGQARNLYDYWERWCWGPLRGRLAGRPGRRVTRLDNGDFEILPASQKRVRGAKVQRLYRDEEDEIPPEISAASVGMLASFAGLPARAVVTSTWHNPRGAMGRLVGEAGARGYRLHKWNIWESLQQCPEARHDGGRNCPSCPLGGACLAKARRGDPDARVGIAAQCCGLIAIDDAIAQLQEWSAQQWQAEAECRRPALTGLVYPQFDRSVHVRADLGFRTDLPTYRAIDWGLNNFVCLWVQLDKDSTAYVVDEYRSRDATVHENAREIVRHDEHRDIEATFCDPAGRNRSDQTGLANVEVFAAAGIPCRYRADARGRSVANGVALVRAALRPAAGRPRLVVSARCHHLIAAFEAYKLRKVNEAYVDEPQKPQEPWEHAMDALRYFLVNTRASARAEAKQMGYR